MKHKLDRRPSFLLSMLSILVAFLFLFVIGNADKISGQPQQMNNTKIESNTVNLLNESAFIWKPVHATVSQTGEKLDMTVETESTDKLWNRAYVQTQLNVTGQGIQEQPIPMLLRLDYVAESLEGNATFVMDIRNAVDPSKHVSAYLQPTADTTQNALTTKIMPFMTISNRPLEFRLYVITDEPGSHILAVERAEISANVTGANYLITNPNVIAAGSHPNNATFNTTSTNNVNPEGKNHPFFWLPF